MSDTLNFVLAHPNEAADRIEALEAALREIADLASHHGVSARAFIDIARAALAPEPRHWPQDAIDQEMIERTDDGWTKSS